MIDNLLGGGDDEGDSEESDVDDMDGGLFADGDDDLMGGGDDLMGGDTDFDEMDGNDGATSAEVDNRIDELENEVASLSSTVNTVKSENDQISESVGNVEENVRKLLEVYEMVTRGVNPFVDESDIGDELDSSVADASADEFFDEDFEGEEGEDDAEEFDDGKTDEEFDDDGESGGGGKSFEELKAEYDSGETEWDDNEEAVTDADGLATAETDDPGIRDVDSDFDTSAPDPNLDDRDEADSSTVGTGSPTDGGKPYLEALPSGYAADIVVMDWLEFLVGEGGVDGAARTIAYYETIEWLDAAAADALQTFLNGFGCGVEDDPDPQSSLTVDHHNTSLRYISRIANPDMGMVAFDGRNDRWGLKARSGMGQSERYSERSFDSNGPESVNPDVVESDGGRELNGSDERRTPRNRPPDRPEQQKRIDERFDWREDHVE
ncbi:MAG: FlaD/FlaE family flagellar protein [Halobacteriota archaeon]|uniref:FlaD/FlaE family flagellar protein n=1 Tax=Natronomonas sp. TaxID=2184060 RepID=UPI00397503B1